jgi:hypothetical protein
MHAFLRIPSQYADVIEVKFEAVHLLAFNHNLMVGSKLAGLSKDRKDVGPFSV